RSIAGHASSAAPGRKDKNARVDQQHQAAEQSRGPNRQRGGLSRADPRWTRWLLRPHGMPAALREHIAADVRAVVQEPDFGDKLSVTGQIANAGGPAEFPAAMQEQRDRLAIAAKELGLKPAQ